jgi:hypothetical protein
MSDRAGVAACTPTPQVRVLIWAVIYTLPATVALLPILDYDIWWHLRTGQWIVEHRALPATDPFSQHGLATGQPLVAYSWLFEVLAYAAYRLLGPEGIFLGRAVLALAIVAALHRLVARREPRFLVATSLLAVGVLALLPLLTDRPWLFTILFATLTLDVILDLREGRPARRAWLLPLLFVFWANLHIQFVHGLFLLGLACAAPVVDRLLRRDDAEDAARAGSRAWWQLVALTAACAAATLLTPYHVGLYEVVRKLATEQVAPREIAECQALGFRDPWDWCVLLLVAATAFALGRRGRASAFEWLLLAAAAWFTFRGKRDVWFGVLAALALVPVPRRVPDAELSFRPTPRQALATAVIVLLLAAAYGGYAASGNHVQATLEAQYPVRAAAFIRERGYAGPLYNDFSWGGYLIWNLPELPVAMDGRTSVHGDARIRQSMATWRGEPGWDADPDLARAAVVLFPARAPLTSLLRQDPRFRVVHEDPLAVVFVPAASPTVVLGPGVPPAERPSQAFPEPVARSAFSANLLCVAGSPGYNRTLIILRSIRECATCPAPRGKGGMPG